MFTVLPYLALGLHAFPPHSYLSPPLPPPHPTSCTASHQTTPAQVEASAVVLNVHAVHVPHLPVEKLGDVRQLENNAHLLSAAS